MSIEDDQSEVMELFETATPELALAVRTKFESDMDDWCAMMDEDLDSGTLQDMLAGMVEDIMDAVKDEKAYVKVIPWFLQ